MTPSLISEYTDLAIDVAKESPCIRRKFGSVIIKRGMADSADIVVSASNSRVGKCCTRTTCARTRFDFANGERVEVGGEIHSEVAALIKWSDTQIGDYFLLAGVSAHDDRVMYGRETYPCHSCAMAIKFAGYKYVYLLDAPDTWAPYSINQIIIEREQEWEPVD